jgi:hypothetical protein
MECTRIHELCKSAQEIQLSIQNPSTVTHSRDNMCTQRAISSNDNYNDFIANASNEICVTCFIGVMGDPAHFR